MEWFVKKVNLKSISRGSSKVWEGWKKLISGGGVYMAPESTLQQDFVLRMQELMYFMRGKEILQECDKRPAWLSYGDIGPLLLNIIPEKSHVHFSD